MDAVFIRGHRFKEPKGKGRREMEGRNVRPYANMKSVILLTRCAAYKISGQDLPKRHDGLALVMLREESEEEVMSTYADLDHSRFLLSEIPRKQKAFLPHHKPV